MLYSSRPAVPQNQPHRKTESKDDHGTRRLAKNTNRLASFDGRETVNSVSSYQSTPIGIKLSRKSHFTSHKRNFNIISPLSPIANPSSLEMLPRQASRYLSFGTLFSAGEEFTTRHRHAFVAPWFVTNCSGKSFETSFPAPFLVCWRLILTVNRAIKRILILLASEKIGELSTLPRSLRL